MLTRTMLILIISSFLFGQSEPDWYKSIPETKGMKYAKGEGNRKMEAVLSGLVDLEQKIKTMVYLSRRKTDTSFTSLSEVNTDESILSSITDGKFILEF
ncbi:uncharacterized protein METZ01_LOCUS404646, partial [marine metagenome]